MAAEQPLEGLVVSEQCKGGTMQVQVKGLNGPDYCKQLALVGAVDALMYIEGATNAGYHVFMPFGVMLREDCSDAYITKVSV
jgi:hypothetical protein